jgi:hypothetical protein
LDKLTSHHINLPVSLYNTLPYAFNMKITMTLINGLLENAYNTGLNIVSFDNTNMFSNVPINDLFVLINLMCSQNNIAKN